MLQQLKRGDFAPQRACLPSELQQLSKLVTWARVAGFIPIFNQVDQRLCFGVVMKTHASRCLKPSTV
jgi:hypothetical protein